ncbi:glycerol-3-phosphate responsive antiterminator [Enterococcus sp. LJL90]
MNRKLYQALENSPIIAAINNSSELTAALATDVAVVFVLHSNLMELATLSKAIKESGKLGFLHADLVKGLSTDDMAIEYISRHSGFDGIISTKPAMIRSAKKHQLLTVQRFFLLDSTALANVERQISLTEADLVEVLPNVSPKIIKGVQQKAKRPLIVGGLIKDKEDVFATLGAGALAISTTSQQVWNS